MSTDVEAGLFEDDLKRCIVDNATPEDNLALVRWVLIALSHHEGARDIVSLAPGASEITAKGYADVFNRLMLLDCREELQKAVQMEGQQALRAATRFFGSTAVRSLFTDPGVSAELDKVDRYFDTEALESLAE
ncbi:MAG: hypothetical protein AAF674_18690 [Pseudomonadota bacterium]